MSKTDVLPLTPLESPNLIRVQDTDDGRHAAIRAGVLDALGVPGNLIRVAVMPLWGNYFRVNVLTGIHSASVNVQNSYFVTADEAGNVLESSPKIQKQF